MSIYIYIFVCVCIYIYIRMYIYIYVYVCMYMCFFKGFIQQNFHLQCSTGVAVIGTAIPKEKKHINEAAKSQDMVVYTKQYPRDTHVKNRGLEHHPTKKGISSPT